MGLVKKYSVIVKEIEHPLPNIYVVVFESQNGIFRYKPGQFLHLTLDEYDPSRQWPESRCFSIQTSPQQEYLKITYSVKGDYTKRIAQELTVGKNVWIKMPYGELFSTLSPKTHCVFIAGGTGVTPYLSLFSSEQFRSFESPVLYFGAHSEQYNIYKKEFEQACRFNPSFKIISKYEDIAGLLNIDHILQQNSLQSVYYLSGPPKMIKSFKIFLASKNVPRSNIKTDEWE